MRSGFSLIEMLIVLAIIATLASMLLFGARALGIGSKKAKTSSIIAALRKGLELTSANKGGSISPVEHPFAPSLLHADVPGGAFPLFKGWRGRPQPPYSASEKASLTPAYNTPILPGVAISGTTYVPGCTLRGAEEWWYVSPPPTLFMDDDLFDDQRVPGFFAMPRAYISVLGAQQRNVTCYWKVPHPKVAADPSSKGPRPYTAGPPKDSNFKFLGYAVTVPSTADNPADNKTALDYVFGSSDIGPELSSLKALFETPTDPTYPPPKDATDPSQMGRDNPTLLLGTLVWSPDQDHGTWPRPKNNEAMRLQPTTFWEPGRVDDGGTWYRYRLRGLAVYDAWGREILYSIGSAGGIRLLSLGADGAYRIDPGNDHVIQSCSGGHVPEDGNMTVDPNSDDRDGMHDNVSQDVSE